MMLESHPATGPVLSRGRIFQGACTGMVLEWHSGTIQVPFRTVPVPGPVAGVPFLDHSSSCTILVPAVPFQNHSSSWSFIHPEYHFKTIPRPFQYLEHDPEHGDPCHNSRPFQHLGTISKSFQDLVHHSQDMVRAIPGPFLCLRLPRPIQDHSSTLSIPFHDQSRTGVPFHSSTIPGPFQYPPDCPACGVPF